MNRLLAFLLGVISSSAVLAQVNVPNPMVRPMAPPAVPTPAGVTPDGLPTPPPAPGVAGSRASLPDLDSPAGAAAMASGAAGPANIRALTGGMYVATIMNRRAILRTTMMATGMPGMGGMPQGALPSMQQGATATPGAAGATAVVPRQMSFTVRDGEKLFLMDSIEVTARVGDKAVELFQERGSKRTLVFRGEVDSIASQSAPRPNQADLQKRNQEYMNAISVSDLSFKGMSTGAATGSGAGAAPAAATNGAAR